MSKNPLKIISVTNDAPSPKRESQIKGSREESQAKLERLWHSNPEQFNPMRNCMERERIQRTWNLIISSISLLNKKVCDLGCGDGLLSERLSQHGAEVDAVDIATQPLNVLQEKALPHLKIIHDYLPRTLLKDNAYDLILSTDVIAYLHKDQHRLYFSELARLMKLDGCVICSTPLDINSEDAFERFSTLALTEFTVERWVLSYHALYLRLKSFIEAPSRFKRAGKEHAYRQKELNKRFSLNYYWFKLNSSAILARFWSFIDWLLRPLISLVRQSSFILLTLEKVCRFIWSERGVSHALFIGKRRPVAPAEPAPIEYERKHKKQVWE